MVISPEGGWHTRGDFRAAYKAYWMIDTVQKLRMRHLDLLSEEQIAELSTPAECGFVPESSDEEGGAAPKAE